MLISKTPVSISCKARQVVRKFSFLGVLGKTLPVFYFLKVNFAKYSILGWQGFLFVFIMLNISSHSLLTCTISAEISIHQFWGFPFIL
jgi:hypothetical protein